MQRSRNIVRRYGALSQDVRSRIIEMAWEDRTPFEAIEEQFGFNEQAVIKIMRNHLKAGSFKNWRSRVSGRVTKHGSRRPATVNRDHCPTQYKHSNR